MGYLIHLLKCDLILNYSLILLLNFKNIFDRFDKSFFR